MTFECKDKISLAKKLAIAVHEDQGQKYGEFPYEHHLRHVVGILLSEGETDKNVIAAAWLHDAVEDTGLEISVVENLLGPAVADIVLRVTDEPGLNRKERKAKTYPKIVVSSEATRVKLADRVANVEHAVLAVNIRMFNMYQKEQAEFSKVLHVEGEGDITQALWRRLDRLFLQEPKIPKLPRPSPEI